MNRDMVRVVASSGRRLLCTGAVLTAISLATACAGTTETNGTTTRPLAEAEPDRPAGSTSWSDAADHVGETLRVCGPLAGMGRDSDDVFLNLGRDYPDPSRFTIVIWDVGGVEPIKTGTTLCTRGEITDYKGVAEIELRSPGDVEVRE
jgi:hypothetical protein